MSCAKKNGKKNGKKRKLINYKLKRTHSKNKQETLQYMYNLFFFFGFLSHQTIFFIFLPSILLHAMFAISIINNAKDAILVNPPAVSNFLHCITCLVR